MIRRLTILMVVVMTVTAVGVSARIGGIGSSTVAASGKTITIGNIGWDEDVAVNNVAKILLQSHYGYTVQFKLADAGPLYLGVASGSLDVFMDTWLPKTQAIYWSRYKSKLVKLHPWYTGANIGLTVPNYVKAKSIADLNKYTSQFGGKITGIEAGAGETNIIQTKVIPGYGLHYTLLNSSTPAMLAALQSAIKNKKWIVVPLWQPHWAFTAYHIRYLKDPKHLMAGSEQLSAIARKGFSKSAPQAYRLLNKMHFTPRQLGTLEVDIRAKGPAAGAQFWINKNKTVVNSWFK